MVTTKHCCWGDCKSDSRYLDDLHNLYFIGFGNGFPKPSKDREKCLRWVNSSGRKYFTINNVSKDTYICSLHFVGGNGPTAENPDPVKCGQEVTRTSRKRKAPTSRPMYKTPKQQRTDKFDAAEALLLLPTPKSTTTKDESTSDGLVEVEKTTADQSEHTAEYSASPFEAQFKDAAVMCTPEVKSTATQTETRSEIVNLGIKNKILENELTLRNSEFKIQRPSSRKRSKKKSKCKLQFYDSFGVDSVKDNDVLFKFYTGLTFVQFLVLWNFLGESTTKISYWNSGVHEQQNTPSKRRGRKRKLSLKDELFMTLIRLRLGLYTQDLAFRFKISRGQVSVCVNTWIQLLYKQFSGLKHAMFAPREKVKKHLPKSFKKYKNIRCIIDCTEVQVEQPTNFEAAGNQYSAYKGHATFKFLVGIAPNGAIMYVSDGFEGSISDKEIVEQSGFLNELNPGDVIMADRGFLITELLQERHVKLIRPPFLGARPKFTPQEEAGTKDIAKHRIHVERSIERMKKFKLLHRIIPQKLRPVFSQCVFVIGCLVNFQKPLVT